MKLQPSIIAEELKSFTFFKSFEEELLAQLATIVKTKSFPAGKAILTEGDSTSSLYFLRSGKVEITLENGRIANLESPGEVFGEISTLSANVASVNVRAINDVECFEISSQDFESVPAQDKDRFTALLYKIYSLVLSQRSAKATEKARLFEVINKELHEAQTVLQRGAGGRVLLVEPDKKRQVPIKMALGASGLIVEIPENMEEARELVKNNKYDVVLCDESGVDLLKHVQAGHDQIFPVFLTSCDVLGTLQVLEQHRYINHIVSRNVEDRATTIRYILTAIGKLLNKDLFGLEKYLMWGAEIQNSVISHSAQREELREEMTAHFRKVGIRSTVLDRVNLAAEEMLMNAVYDAPVDSNGNHLFNHISRKEEVSLEKHQCSVFSYASDGVMIAVSVKDPFGSLTKEIIVDYLLSCYNNQAGSMNENKGGAGRGLHLMLEAADLTIFNVKKGVSTEVISLFYVEQRRESNPAFHYFFI